MRTAVVWLLALGAAPLSGQAMDSVVSPGQYVRASTDQRRLEGWLREIDENRLVIEADTGGVALDVSAVDSLWVRGRSTRTGFLVGAGVGAGLTLAVCLASSDECGLDVGLLVVTPTLALFGGAVGSVLPSWDRVTPPPPAPKGRLPRRDE